MIISYVLPCFNVEKYIVKCLDSIYNQEIDRDLFEVICINDGSRDGTERLLSEYAKTHNNLVFQTIENSGQSIARNIGARLAKGKYVFFVDSDDYITENSMKSVMECIADTRADLVFFDWYRVDEENCNPSCRFSSYEKGKHEVIDGRKYFNRYFPGNGAWQFVIKRQFLIDNRLSFIPKRYFEDGMFVLDCIRLAQTCVKCDSDVYRYIKRSNSTTTLASYKHLKKVNDDFLFTILYFHDALKKDIQGGYDEKYIERLTDRRNSYTFHLQTRMVRYGVTKNELNYIVNKLKENGCYPYKTIKADYKGVVHTVLYNIYQNEILFRFFVKVQYLIKCKLFQRN